MTIRTWPRHADNPTKQPTLVQCWHGWSHHTSPPWPVSVEWYASSGLGRAGHDDDDGVGSLRLSRGTDLIIIRRNLTCGSGCSCKGIVRFLRVGMESSFCLPLGNAVHSLSFSLVMSRSKYPPKLVSHRTSAFAGCMCSLQRVVRLQHHSSLTCESQD